MYFLPIALSLAEFLLHGDMKNLNLSKSRPWVSDSNLYFILFYYFIYFIYVFLPFLGLIPWHMEVPRLGV